MCAYNGYKRNYHLEKKFREFSDMRDLLATSAEKYGDRVAFVTKIKKKDDPDNPEYINTTYGEMLGHIRALGTALWYKGFQREKIALIAENSYRWVLSYCTVTCGPGIIVPLDKLLKKEELEGLLARSGAKAVFCDKAHYKDVKAILEGDNTALEVVIGVDFLPEDGYSIDDLIAEGEALLEDGHKGYVEAEIDRDSLAIIVFTSGTTDKAKGVMLSQKNVMSVNYYMNLEEYFTPDDVNLMVLPLNHVYGMGGLTIFMSQGMKTAFCDGLRYITMNLEEYGVSVMMTVPLLLESIYKRIIKTIEKNGMEDKVEKALRICDAADRLRMPIRRKVFSSIIDALGGKMRFMINGAAALDPKVSKGMNDFGILTVQGYGLTETSPTISSETYRYLKPGSCGKVLPYVETKIEDPDEDGIGELLVRGDNVMMGYYDDPEETAKVMEDGWFHTGDYAHFDSDDYLWISGRKKNVIVMKNGKNVFPEEIEQMINKLPYISESIVFSMKKATDIVLWVKIVVDEDYMRDSESTLSDIEKIFDLDLDRINDKMPAYKMVKHFFVSKKPAIRNTTKKIKRHEEIKNILEEMKERNIKNDFVK